MLRRLHSISLPGSRGWRRCYTAPLARSETAKGREFSSSYFNRAKTVEVDRFSSQCLLEALYLAFHETREDSKLVFRTTRKLADTLCTLQSKNSRKSRNKEPNSQPMMCSEESRRPRLPSLSVKKSCRGKGNATVRFSVFELYFSRRQPSNATNKLPQFRADYFLDSRGYYNFPTKGSLDSRIF